eukprot:248496_1
MRCIGSLPHLQTKYGDGYQLDFNAGSADGDVDLLKTFIEETFPEQVLLEAHGTNIKYRIPTKGHTLGNIFRIIEKNVKSLNIVEYSVSGVTLEQIFIYFAKLENIDEMRESDVPRVDNTHLQIAESDESQPLAMGNRYAIEP